MPDRKCARIVISMNKKNEMGRAVSNAKQSLISAGYSQDLKIKQGKRSIVVVGCKS